MRFKTLMLALVVAAATPCLAGEIEFRHGNDLFSGTQIEDDLYTASIGLGGTVAGWTIDLNENMFTDKVSDLRFDETYLTLNRRLTRPGTRWDVQATAGVVRVGKGIFGQGAQNFIHRILGEDEVDLPYVTASQTHLFLRASVARPFALTDRVALTPAVEAESAVFKRHARASVELAWNLDNGFGVSAEAGLRYSESNFSPLVPWIDESAPLFAVGAHWRRRVSLTWTENAYGTADRHWNLVLRLPIGKPS